MGDMFESFWHITQKFENFLVAFIYFNGDSCWASLEKKLWDGWAVEMQSQERESMLKKDGGCMREVDIL